MFGKQLTLKGKLIMLWLRNCSPFSIYRLLLFTLCAMPYALCELTWPLGESFPDPIELSRYITSIEPIGTFLDYYLQLIGRGWLEFFYGVAFIVNVHFLIQSH